MTAASDPLTLSRRRFLALCAATATATMLPVTMRIRAAQAYAASAFAFTAHERAVLVAAADTVIPAATVRGRMGTMTVPGAGETGAVDFIENLLTGSLIFAAGTQRPGYVKLPPGVTAPQFPATGANAMWTVKRIGWYGDGPRPARPYRWPSELQRLQSLYHDGVASLDGAVPGGDFSNPAAAPFREPVLRAMQAEETSRYNGKGEGNQPFFLTLLDHLAQACFGDPVYGGNGGNDPTGKNRWIYWKLIGFTGPSFINSGGPAPGQGWTAADMNRQFDPTRVV